MRTLIVSLLISSAALAEELKVEQATPEPKQLEVSLVGGAHFPQLTNKLNTSFDGMLRIGWAPPVASRRLQIFVDLGYSQPTNTVKGSDARLDGASYSSTLTVQDLSTTVGLKFFILPTTDAIVPYLGAGLRFHFLKTNVTGTGASAFGQYHETATEIGGVGFFGAGFHLGPGWVLAELAFGYAPVDQQVTGTTNIGALSLLLGYGVLF